MDKNIVEIDDSKGNNHVDNNINTDNVIKENMPVVSDRFFDITDDFELMFKTMECGYTPPITYHDEQPCDQSKSIYKEDYYYSDDDIHEIGKDYMMYMLNTKEDERRQLNDTNFIIRSSNIVVKTDDIIGKKNEILQDLRSVRRDLNMYYNQFKNEIDNMYTQTFSQPKSDYMNFIKLLDFFINIIPDVSRVEFIDLLCNVAAFLRYYGIAIDVRIFMNILKCFIKGYDLSKTISIIVNGHSLLSFENNVIVKCLKFSNKSKVNKLKAMKDSVDYSQSPTIRKDYMMIIGRYLTTFRDYINLTKVSTEYKDIIDMFKYNPIEDNEDFFSNKETRCFYSFFDYRNCKDFDYDILDFRFDVGYKNYLKIKADMTDCDLLFKDVILDKDFDDEDYIGMKIQGKFLFVSDCISKLSMSQFSCSYRDFKEIVLPSGLRSIPHSCLLGTCIKSVTIPESVTSIDDKAFFECFSLKTVIFEGNNVAIIKDRVFQECNIKDINIPEGVTRIGDSCFSFCNRLTNITLPSTLKSIGKYAFNKTCLKDINMPDGVTEIGRNCFTIINKINKFNIPSGLKKVGTNLFSKGHINELYIPYTFDAIDLSFMGHVTILNLHIRKPLKVKIGTNTFTFEGTAVDKGKCDIYSTVNYNYDFNKLVDYIKSNGNDFGVEEEVIDNLVKVKAFNISEEKTKVLNINDENDYIGNMEIYDDISDDTSDESDYSDETYDPDDSKDLDRDDYN